MTIDYYKWNNLDTDSESELDPDSKTGMALNSPQPEGNIKNRASVPQSVRHIIPRSFALKLAVEQSLVTLMAMAGNPSISKWLKNPIAN